MAAKFSVFVDKDHDKRPPLNWLPKLHKIAYKSRLIANFSACTTTTTELSILLISCLTAIKIHVIEYFETVIRGMVKLYFELLKIQARFLII